jgi:tRNA threonylcarbamoyladenosine biosynthesis protein TsaE
MRIELPTAADTHAFGVALSTVLRAGDLIILSGPLGAGKTALAQGIGAGLGVDGPVTSPTFVLSRIHTGGRLRMVHVDAYRLGSVSEVDDLDLDAGFEDSVTVVEWGEGKAEQLSEEHLTVHLERHIDDDVRIAELEPAGAGWPNRLEKLPALTDCR